jgi:hypothetical protein
METQMERVSAVAVLTARSPERLLREGGSQAWVLNPVNARKHQFLVAIQNQHNGKWGGASEPHGTAFLIGRISDVVPSTDEDTQEGRYLIKISEYARIKVEHKWKGRNPVRYVTLDELGIDPSQIEFIPMPTFVEGHDASNDERDPASNLMPDHPIKRSFLTIPEAKEGLAATLGVSIDKIEITIKA